MKGFGIEPPGVRVPKPFTSEEPFFEEKVHQGFFMGLRVQLRTLFVQRTLFGRKISLKIVEIRQDLSSRVLWTII